MVHFRERWAVGSWAVEPIFTKRILRTVDFQIEGPKFDLCRDVTRFVKRESVVPPPKTKTRASASREGLMPPRATFEDDARNAIDRYDGCQINRAAPTPIMRVPSAFARMSPFGAIFSIATRRVSAAIQSRFIAPPTNSKAISAQQQPRQ
jgi:hypothetical protein